MADDKPVRVVIADDEINLRLLMKRIVLSLGYYVVGEASNGVEALELFEKEKPDMLLLDIKMPLKKGDEVLEEIFRKFPDACVVMMTSVADSATVRKCLKSGAANYILKTKQTKEIKVRIQETYYKHIQKNTD